MNYDQIISISALIGSIFSLLGSIFVIGIYLSFKSLRTFSFKIVFFLSISDFVRSISFIIRPDIFFKNSTVNPVICKIQAFFLSYSSLLSLFLVSLISFTIYSFVLKNENNLVKKYKNWKFLDSFFL